MMRYALHLSKIWLDLTIHKMNEWLTKWLIKVTIVFIFMLRNISNISVRFCRLQCELHCVTTSK